MKRRHTVVLLLLTATIGAHAREVNIQWSTIKGAFRYELEISREARPVKQVQVANDTREWEGDLPTGAYLYRVRGIDRMSQPGKWSEAQALFVVPDRVEMLSPESGIESEAKPTASVTLAWQPVSGASRYLVDVLYGKRSVFKKQVAATFVQTIPLGPGKYVWTCRAMVELKGKAPKGTNPAKGIGPAAKPWNFVLIPPGVRRGLASESLTATTGKPRRFQLEIALAAASYNYSIDSGSTGDQGATNALAAGIRLGLAYGISKSLSLTLDASEELYRVSGLSFDRNEIGLGAAYSLSLGNSARLVPQIALGFQEFFGLQRTSTDDSTPPVVTTVMAAGPLVGLKASMNLTRSVALEVQGRYFHPLKLVTAPTDTTLESGGANFAAAFGARYTVDPDWALYAGVAYQNRPMNFTLSGQAFAETTTYTSLQGQFGISFSFGGELR